MMVRCVEMPRLWSFGLGIKIYDGLQGFHFSRGWLLFRFVLFLSLYGRARVNVGVTVMFFV